MWRESMRRDKEGEEGKGQMEHRFFDIKDHKSIHNSISPGQIQLCLSMHTCTKGIEHNFI